MTYTFAATRAASLLLILVPFRLSLVKCWKFGDVDRWFQGEALKVKPVLLEVGCGCVSPSRVNEADR